MATTNTWTGAVNGDINTAGNWVNGVPGDTDHVIVPRDATVDMTGSMAALVSTIASWTVEPGCTIKIGASGNLLEVGITRLVYMGAGEMWFDADAVTTVDTIIEASSADAIIHIDQATFTNVRIFRGNVTLDGNIGNIADLHVGYISDIPNDVKLTITANGNTISRFVQNGGTVTGAMAITDLNIKTGNHWLTGSVAATRVNVEGGTFFANTTGTIATATVHGGGTFDFTQGSGQRDVTTLWAYPGSTIRSIRSLVGSDDVGTFEDQTHIQ